MYACTCLLANGVVVVSLRAHLTDVFDGVAHTYVDVVFPVVGELLYHKLPVVRWGQMGGVRCEVQVGVRCRWE